MKNYLKLTLIAVSAMALSMGVNAKITIGGNNKQSTNVQGAVINTAAANAKAVQNVSANHGTVNISGNNTQSSKIQGALINTAAANSKAVQNLSSNSSNSD